MKENIGNKSNHIGIGIVGAGYWGPNLIRNFDNIKDCQIKYVCEKKPGRLNYIKQKWPHLNLTKNFNKLITDSKVDAVVIATPVSTHCTLAKLALEEGKHVFIEKPLSIRSTEAEDIVELASRKKLTLATGHIFVYHPAVSLMKEIIEKGEIGTCCYVESGRINLGPPASEVDVVWDLAVHDISILLYLWEKEPIEVRAVGYNYIHPSLIDAAFITLHFDDNSISHHHVSWLSPEKVRRFFVAGNKGALKFNDALSKQKLKYIDQGEDSRIGLNDDETKDLFYKPGKIFYPKISNEEPLRVECEHFLKCIQNGDPPKANGVAGAGVVRILEAAEKSIKNKGTPVELKKK